MKFEEYIRTIRPMMDTEQPDEDHIWAGISQSLKDQKRIQYWKYALLAAGMIVIVFAAGFHFTNKSENFGLDTELSVTSITTANSEIILIHANQETKIITQIPVVKPANDEKLKTEKLSDNEYIAKSEIYEKADTLDNQTIIVSIVDPEVIVDSELIIIQSLDISLLEDYTNIDEKVTKKTEKWFLVAAFGTVGTGGFADSNKEEYIYDDVTYSLRKSAIIDENHQNSTADHQSLYYMSKNDFTNIQHRQPISFGLITCKNIGQYIGVESGLVYTYLSSRFEWSGYYTNQNLHYMGIPVNLLIYMSHSKSNWKFYISGGGMVEKGMRNISRQERRFGSETRITNLKTSIDGLQWSLNGGLGVNYRLERGWGIYFEPRIGYCFDNNQPVNIRTEWPVYFGINLGLNYKF